MSDGDSKKRICQSMPIEGVSSYTHKKFGEPSEVWVRLFIN